MISVFPWSCICLLLLTFYSNQSPRGHSVTLTPWRSRFCVVLPCYIRTGRWDLQSMAKVMKLEVLSQKVLPLLSWFSWIACSEETVTMLWGHSGNSGERPPHRGTEALTPTTEQTCWPRESPWRQIQPLPSLQVMATLIHIRLWPQERRWVRTSLPNHRKWETINAYCYFKSSKFGVFFFLLNSKTQLTYISSILGQKTHGRIYYINIYYL